MINNKKSTAPLAGLFFLALKQRRGENPVLKTLRETNNV
jgi:hypothetical protein